MNDGTPELRFYRIRNRIFDVFKKHGYNELPKDVELIIEGVVADNITHDDDEDEGIAPLPEEEDEDEEAAVRSQPPPQKRKTYRLKEEEKIIT